MGILLTHARIVLRVMEDGGVMENANGAMINAKCIIMTMMIVIIVVNMIMIVGNHVCASKAELTKYIFDCQQQGSQEVSYSLEKMESCLQQKFMGIIPKIQLMKWFVQSERMFSIGSKNVKIRQIPYIVLRIVCSQEFGPPPGNNC